MNKDGIKEKVRQIVLSVNSLDGSVSADVELNKLGFDSLDISTIFAEIENVFGIEVEIEIAMGLKTINEIAGHLTERLSIEQT